MSVPSFTTSGTLVLSSLNPIVGDREQTTSMPATTVMTTGDLAPYDVGDASGTGDPVVRRDLTIEFWFAFSNDATPASTQVLASGPEVSAGVRQWQVSVTTTGAISLTVRHATSGAITATSAAGLASLQPAWTHVVGVLLSASNLILYVNGVSVATTAWPAGVVTTASYAAGVSDMRIGSTTTPEDWLIANLAFYNAGLTAGRVSAHYTAGTARGFPTQLSGTRIGAVLDAAGSDAPRAIDSGVRSVTPTYMRGQTPKDAAEEALSADAVDAALFISASGTVVYLDADHRSSSPYNTSQATFGDAAGELAYVDVTLDYADSFIANEWNVTREGSASSVGVTQTVRDTTSINRYFKRSQSVTSLPVVDDAAALAVATANLAKYALPMQRITGLTFSTLDPNVSEAIFRRELGDKITVLRTPPGGGARISQLLWIQKIDVSASNDGTPASVRWGVSPV